MRSLSELPPEALRVWVDRLPDNCIDLVEGFVLGSDSDPGGHKLAPVDLTPFPDPPFCARDRASVRQLAWVAYFHLRTEMMDMGMPFDLPDVDRTDPVYGPAILWASEQGEEVHEAVVFACSVSKWCEWCEATGVAAELSLDCCLAMLSHLGCMEMGRDWIAAFNAAVGGRELRVLELFSLAADAFLHPYAPGRPLELTKPDRPPPPPDLRTPAGPLG